LSGPAATGTTGARPRPVVNAAHPVCGPRTGHGGHRVPAPWEEPSVL
jgi:hypothetical protein